MRLIHTSDWHLGRLFHGLHLTRDQEHVLEELLKLVQDVRPDLVVVAGDVFDRAVPPPDAVGLLDEVLTRLAEVGSGPVLLLAGNHDGPERLSFGARLLQSAQVHLIGRPVARPEPLLLEDRYGPVAIQAVPYAEPARIRELLEDPDLQGHDAALGALLERARQAVPEGMRSVVVAHAFVRGAQPSDSERPLTVGGAGEIGAERFRGFTYGALGHLHRPQWVGPVGRLRYSGSLLPYSFAEADHSKSVSLVEIDSSGMVACQEIHLSPRRGLRILEGELETLLAGPDPGESTEDYLLVRLLDASPVLDPMGRLRRIYPNLLQVERPGLMAALEQGVARVDPQKLGDLELLRCFYRQVQGEPPRPAEEAIFTEALESLRRRDREEKA